MNYTNDIKDYLQNVKETIDRIPVNEFNQLINLLNRARDEKRTIFICGNGGSAATASHFCCDFNKGISSNQEQKFRMICLSDNIPTMMAYANDFNYEEIFIGPLRNLLSPGDYVIGLSGSGNSKNVVNALEYANQHGGVTIAITGYDGGKLKEISQYNLHVPVMNMQIAEDMHMIIDHCIMTILCQYGEQR